MQQPMQEERTWDQLIRRKDYENALRVLERFKQMSGGKLTEPSGIVRHSRSVRWQSRQEERLDDSAASCERGRAK